MRAVRAGLVAVLLAVGLTVGTGLALPGSARACSCVGPQPLAAYAGPDTVILAGTVISDDGDGIRIGVDRWFSGTGATPVALVAGDFGNGASCGLGSRPAVGSAWVGVLFRPREEGLGNPLEADALYASICQPFVGVDTPEGVALVEEAVAAFGGGEAVPNAPQPSPSPSPEAPAAAAEDGGGTETIALVAVIATLAAGAAVLAVALLAGTRRGRDRVSG